MRRRFRGFNTVTFPVRGKQPPAFATASPTQKVSGVLDPAGVPLWFNGVLPTLSVEPAGRGADEGHDVHRHELPQLGPAEPAQCPAVLPAVHPGRPMAAYPSDPPQAFPPYIGTNHGVGLLNRGLHDNDPATTTTPNASTVTFAAPGTFQLKCLAHEGMDATVNVTP